MDKAFYVYRSSAGSGKTRTLAKEYIKLALRWDGDYFRYILAVTFANKATQEMKERILQYLSDFAAGRTNNLAEEIKLELGLDDRQLQRQSQWVLSNILHRYSQFAISTIDAFFQRVIRAFTREAGVLGNFRLEVDNEMVLDEVLAALMDELGHNHQLTRWVVQFSRDRLREGENWNVLAALRGFLMEIFKEQFKAIEHQVIPPNWTAQDHERVIRVLNDEVDSFFSFMQARAQRALRILQENGITVDDFNYKDQGTAYKYFFAFARREYTEPKARIQSAMVSSSDWPSRKGRNYQRLKDLAEQSLMPLLNEMVQHDKQNGVVYKSAKAVLDNYYAYGLITDVTRKLREYKEENNLMLLSDASQFLNGIINNSDTPFIYEKVGSYFKNYLIDEFQDTSGFQWKNFVPLLKEASDQGNANLIVGDVKQSIYRWRGGDLELLQREVVKEFGSQRVQIVPLNTNYRSAGKIVDFNNKFFTQAVQAVTSAIGQALPTEVYHDAEQHLARLRDQGFVRINFMQNDEEDDWKDQTLRALPRWLEQLQDKGVKLKDIAILVRKNDEGQRIANFLLQFRHSPQAKPHPYKYDVVSNESLRLDASRSVNIIISALRFLKNPDDAVARGQLVYEAAAYAELGALFEQAKANKLDGLLPDEFLRRSRQLIQLSLFELTEELIRLFALGEQTEELAYLQAFQDAVLEFAAREKTDLGSFLDWWEIYKEKKSIQVSAAVDAVNILTIHKSKGLQFKYVIIPFCDWSMSHDGLKTPLLWVQSDRPPFREIGKVAVKFNRNLTETMFSQDYHSEYTKVHLDNLNLLYVAFTRAEQGLIVYTRAKGDKLSNVGELALQAVQTSELKAHCADDVLSIGEVGYWPDEVTQDGVETVQSKQYASHDWRTKLVIKQQGTEFFQEVSDKRSKINRGILVHQVLSRIHYKTQAEDVLSQFFLETALPEEEVARLRAEVNGLLDHPIIGMWFNKEWQVRTEALVLLPGFAQKRIDRMMFGKNRTVLVDYKTGKKKPDDKEQVERYAQVLAEMGYPNVQAYLVYLDGLRVEEVVSKSNLSLF